MGVSTPHCPAAAAHHDAAASTRTRASPGGDSRASSGRRRIGRPQRHAVELDRARIDVSFPGSAQFVVAALCGQVWGCDATPRILVENREPWQGYAALHARAPVLASVPVPATESTCSPDARAGL